MVFIKQIMDMSLNINTIRKSVIGIVLSDLRVFVIIGHHV